MATNANRRHFGLQTFAIVIAAAGALVSIDAYLINPGDGTRDPALDAKAKVELEAALELARRYEPAPNLVGLRHIRGAASSFEGHALVCAEQDANASRGDRVLVVDRIAVVPDSKIGDGAWFDHLWKVAGC